MSNNEVQQPAPVPMPEPGFSVDWGTRLHMVFGEISSLVAQTEAPAPGKVTMRKGTCPLNDSFWTWYNAIKMNSIKPQSVVIKTPGENNRRIETWTLVGATPVTIHAESNKDSNGVAIDILEVAYVEMIFNG